MKCNCIHHVEREVVRREVHVCGEV
jgi:hypothetical protein